MVERMENSVKPGVGQTDQGKEYSEIYKDREDKINGICMQNGKGQNSKGYYEVDRKTREQAGLEDMRKWLMMERGDDGWWLVMEAFIFRL